ncbi:hypothetical protein B6U99_01340 [Candidatus Geothermarchaeota archaeon ex4572_27]|nr:MAG: hypothetical protein B6U99_01340 [Candidatus Geothermarchaeota archaeon ex4572_27]
MASLSEAEGLYGRYRKGEASAEDVREFVRKVRDERGMPWLIAAMADANVGYYSSQSAELQIERFLDVKNEGYAERTMCLYNCDLALEILSDIRYFLLLEERDRERVRKKKLSLSGSGTRTTPRTGLRAKP